MGNNIRQPLVAACAVSSCLMANVSFASLHEYTWDASNPSSSFGDGKVTLDLDGATINTMNVGVADFRHRAQHVSRPGRGDAAERKCQDCRPEIHVAHYIKNTCGICFCRSSPV